MALHLASTPEANTLLAHDPLALLIGMLLDQQIPLEKAFTSPQVLRERLGHDLDVHDIAAYDPEQFEEIFKQTPALHRFPGAMAKRVQDLARLLIERFDADPASVWTSAADGKDMVKRIAMLPGFGEQKARIFAALLAKQFNVTPTGWREATAPFGEQGSYVSVADIVDAESLLAVRKYKQEMKAAAKAKK